MAGAKPAGRALTVGRVAAVLAALLAGLAAAAVGGYGVLLLVAIPDSDTATSSLLAVGLGLVAAGVGLVLLGWLLARRALR